MKRVFKRPVFKFRDSFVEKKWDELTDVPFDEGEDGTLRLASKWYLFPKGTDRDAIWNWFDKNHSKGVSWLLYEREVKAIL